MSAIAVVVVLVVLIAIGGAVVTIPAISMGCPSDEGDDSRSKLHTIPSEFILNTWRYLIEGFACDQSTLLKSTQRIR